MLVTDLQRSRSCPITTERGVAVLGLLLAALWLGPGLAATALAGEPATLPVTFDAGPLADADSGLDDDPASLPTDSPTAAAVLHDRRPALPRLSLAARGARFRWDAPPRAPPPFAHG
jgi:hypothetical protein